MAKAGKKKAGKSNRKSKGAGGLGGNQLSDLAIAVSAPAEGADTVTARVAGSLVDLKLDISPRTNTLRASLGRLAKAINIALQEEFLETGLEPAFSAARVHKGRVEMLHREYIGLGDGFMAQIGRFAKSIKLTLEGPDPVSPEGMRAIEEGEGGAFGGVLDLMGRKLNLIAEYEDQVPFLVEQMLDRLESVNLITGWNRHEWEISTTTVGLDVVLTPVSEDDEEAATRQPGRERRKKKKKSKAKKKR